MVYLFLTKKTDSTDSTVARLANKYCTLVGLSDDDFTVARAERGKPYFPNTPSVHFSVSHSGDIFACAFSDAPVGVDIQEYKHRPDEAERCKKIAARFFHLFGIERVEYIGTAERATAYPAGEYCNELRLNLSYFMPDKLVLLDLER